MERFLDYFEPENYKLDIFIDKKAKTIGGKVMIKGRAKAENIKFHAVGLSVSRVLVNGKKADFETANGVRSTRGRCCGKVCGKLWAKLGGAKNGKT